MNVAFVVQTFRTICKVPYAGKELGGALQKGEGMLLKQLYEQGHCNLVDGPLEWKEALLEGIKPLIADGSVDPEYGDCLIENVEKLKLQSPITIRSPCPISASVFSNSGDNRSGIPFSICFSFLIAKCLLCRSIAPVPSMSVFRPCEFRVYFESR